MSNSFKPQTPEADTSKLTIACAADLFRHLRSSTLGVRLSVLAAISRAPKKALSYGPHHGTDLIKELCDQLNLARQTNLRQTLLGTLSVFKDARVAPVMRTLFRTSRHPKEIAICAQRLACEPASAVNAFFLDQLKPPIKLDQARWAANMLARKTGHAPADAVYIAVRCDVPFSTPPLDDDTEAAWLAALQGDCARNAQILLETMGEAAFNRLRPQWPVMPIALKQWLLNWGGRANFARVVELCLDTLEEETEDMLIAALDAIARFGSGRRLFRSAVSRFGRHPEKRIRAAALKAGAQVADVRAMLAAEPDPKIRLLLIPRLASAYGEAAVDDLLKLFDDADWRIRSMAVTSLASLGAGAIAATQRRSEDKRIEVRVAAAQVLDRIAEDT